MFLFLIAAIPVAVGAYVLGEVAKDVNTKVTSNNTAETITKEKKNITKNGESVIGIIDPTLTQKSTTLLGLPTTLTVDKFDTTTYADRAIIKLTNNNGYITFLRGLAIKGKLVTKLAGKNGYVWEYSDYESIEKEGEKFVEVSNDFIFSPSQAKNIGDFVWKELKPHKMYALGLVGTHYEYEIGDVYHLTLTHTMNSGTMENIDTDVEVMGVTLNRSVGGVGSTVLNLRVPSEAWALTLAKNAKLVGAANAQRLNNRSNVVTVASSDWTGQADYFCDGTDDNVEIQAAIDYVSGIGGGVVNLTAGTFNISKAGTVLYYSVANDYGVEIKAGVTLNGAGNKTILLFTYESAPAILFYCAPNSYDISVSSMSCDSYTGEYDNNIEIIWTGLCINTRLNNISTKSSFCRNNSASGTGYPAGSVTISSCSFILSGGSYMSVTGCNFSVIALGSFCTVTSCIISGSESTAVVIYGESNSVTCCSISPSTKSITIQSGATYNVVCSNVAGTIQNNGGATNIIANNS